MMIPRRITIAIYVLLIFSFLSGCDGNLKNYLHKNANRVVITFNNSSVSSITAEPLTKTLEIKDMNTIAILIDGISDSSAPFYKCGYDGCIFYYNGSNELLPDGIQFNVSPECPHLTYSYGNRFFSRKISKEAIDYLQKTIER